MNDEIFPYQAEGAAWMASRERSGLHDEAGLGKTWTAISALDMCGWKRGIVVARAMLRHEWMMEHKKRAQQERRLVKGRSIHDFIAWQRGSFDVLLLSFEMATRWARHFAELGEVLDFLIIDEAHFVRNPMAERTKRLLGDHCDGRGGIVQWAQQVYHLTGTPMDKDPMDIWAFLRLSGAIHMSRHDFQNYFFGGTPFAGPNRVMKHRVDELRVIYRKVALRRTLAQVGIELPEIFYTPLVIEGDTASVDSYFRDHPGLDARIIDALERGNLSFIEGAHLMTLRRLFAEAKALPFASYITEALKSGEIDKVVIMGYHVGALETIDAKLQAAGLKGYLVNGATPEWRRIEARDKFQTDPDVRFFVGNSGAAGAGITLHAAAHLFVFESEWNPGSNEQMIKRIRRIGQKRQQHARFVTLAGSLDERISDIVMQKTKAIAAAQGEEMLTLPKA